MLPLVTQLKPIPLYEEDGLLDLQLHFGEGRTLYFVADPLTRLGHDQQHGVSLDSYHQRLADLYHRHFAGSEEMTAGLLPCCINVVENHWVTCQIVDGDRFPAQLGIAAPYVVYFPIDPSTEDPTYIATTSIKLGELGYTEWLEIGISAPPSVDLFAR